MSDGDVVNTERVEAGSGVGSSGQLSELTPPPQTILASIGSINHHPFQGTVTSSSAHANMEAQKPWADTRITSAANTRSHPGSMGIAVEIEKMSI